jgi:hypothetical protein
MPNYKEANVNGTMYTRANRVVLQNELDAPKSITFSEQEIITLPDTTRITRPARGVGVVLDDKNIAKSFDLLHPETGAVLGTVSYQDVYVLMHSLYYHLAHERDSALAAKEQT